MAGFPIVIDQRYLLDNTGRITAGTVYMYYSGTTVLAPVYSDGALTVGAANPITVAAGSPMPTRYLDPNITYRRLLVLADGTNIDVDPYNTVASSSFLPLTGGTITGDLTVNGQIKATKVIGTSPNSGTTGGVIVRDALGNPDAAYLQFTNNNGSVQYGTLRGLAAGGFEFTGPITFSGSNSKITLPASTTDHASMNIPTGVAPTSPINGDIWSTATQLFMRLSGATSEVLTVKAMSLANPGYIHLTNGFKIQFGTLDQGPNSGTTVTYPIAFTTFAVPVVTSSSKDGDVSAPTQNIGLASYTLTTMRIWNTSDETYPANWIVVGV